MRKLNPLLSRALVALLYALGLTLPVLGALGLMHYALPCCALLLGICAALTAASLNKTAGIALAAAGLGGLGIYLFALGGLDTLREVVMAMVLQLSGVQGALPLVAAPCAIVLTVLFGLLGWALTSPSMGFYPGMALLLLVLLVLWITSRTALLWCTLPGLAALVVMFIRSSHEHVPLGRVLPLATLAVLASFLLTPSSGVVVPALEEFSDQVRQCIFDYLFFTEPRNVFTLATEGYYPQGTGQLGGPANPTDHPVMSVRTPRRVLLRGAVMNEYTGRMWRNTTGGRRYLYVSPRWRSERQTIFDMSLPQGRALRSASILNEQTITIRMMDDNASSLFVPQRIRKLDAKGDLVPYFNQASEVFITRDLAAGDTYSITAPLVMAGDAGLGTLLDACAATDDPHYAAIQQTYLQLPDHLQQQVFDLAAKVTQEAQSPYDKAFALQNFLTRTYRYTLETEEQNSNIDFVTDFLFNTQEGYCTYFASAMTVLCRMVGLPARYVEGYQAIPDENGIARVTGLQAHAWTEVYFPGFGWLTFDATPVQSDPKASESSRSSDSPESEPTPTPTPEPNTDPAAHEEPTPTPTPPPNGDSPTPSPEPSPDPPPQQDPPPNLTWLWLLLLLLALAAAAALRIWWTMPQQLVRKATEPLAQFNVWMQAVHDALAVRHQSRGAAESPIAYGRRLDASGLLPLSMLPLCEALSLVIYGKLVPEPEEIAMAQQAYQALLAGLNPWQRIQLAVRRAVIPLKKRDFAHP